MEITHDIEIPARELPLYSRSFSYVYVHPAAFSCLERIQLKKNPPGSDMN